MHIRKRGEEIDDEVGPDGVKSLTVDNETGKARKTGWVEFRGEKVPWEEGVYEFRFHHDGKYNVMAATEPFEIYGQCRSLLSSGFYSSGCFANTTSFHS
jgi:hypothetical protein